MINIVIPEWYREMNGFNEILQDEIATYVKSKTKIPVILSQIHPIKNAEIYLFVAQYREEARGNWIKDNIPLCKEGALIGVCGKAMTEASEYALEMNERLAFAILGEAELSFVEVIEVFNKGTVDDLAFVKGIIFKDSHGVIHKNSYRNCVDDYDSLPLPTLTYLYKGVKYYPICTLLSSRGCHGTCKFCEGHLCRSYNPGPIYRAKSANRMFNEVKYAKYQYNQSVFSFADDNFFVDGIKGKYRAIDFAELLIRNNIRIKYTIECRADDIDFDTFKILKKSGLHKVFVGIESGAQSFLDRIGKGTTVSQNAKAIETLNSLGILCEPGYIFFDPLTTIVELRDSLRFFKYYQDILYSLPTGNGGCRMYFPEKSELLKSYWPNQTSEYYKAICNEEIDYPFFNDDIENIYMNYIKLLCENKGTPNLKNRLACLETALN